MLRTLTRLFLSFLKIGTFTIGGGYAMIPLIQREAVDIRRWATEDEMADYIALGQSLPGVVGINAATAVGAKTAGTLGALAATIGMVTPSFVVISLISVVFTTLLENALVNAAFSGVRAAVAALVASAIVRLFKSGVKDWFQGGLAVCAFTLIWIFNVPAPFVLLGAGASGVCRAVLRRDTV